MDDLSGLDWSSNSNKPANKFLHESGHYYPALRPTPSPQNSGRNTPLSQTFHPLKGTPSVPPKSTTPDSFANLVNFGSSRETPLTLQEQQERLQQENSARELDRHRDQKSQLSNARHWGDPETKRSTESIPAVAGPLVTTTSKLPGAEKLSPFNYAQENSILATFSAESNLDSSTLAGYYPRRRNLPITDLLGSDAETPSPTGASRPFPCTVDAVSAANDDDPFGLEDIQYSTSVHVPRPATDDDDILGDLAKPLEEVRRSFNRSEETLKQTVALQNDDPWDKAVKELEDMGFSAEQSRRALATAGLDVQTAISLILGEAHRASSQSHLTYPTNEISVNERGEIPRDHPTSLNTHQSTRPASANLDSRNSSPSGEVDLVKTAAVMGSNLLNTANSLWKSSQKKVQRAVLDFQQEPDRTQPRWMREGVEKQGGSKLAFSARKERSELPKVTDEALMLERSGRPPSKQPQASASRLPELSPLPLGGTSHVSRGSIPAVDRKSLVPRLQNGAAIPTTSKSRLVTQLRDEQITGVYVSPARRKNLPQDFASSSRSVVMSPSTAMELTSVNSKPESTAAKTVRSDPAQTLILQRPVPAVSPTDLATSTQHRLRATSQFKRGDYAAAHASYTSSIAVLPTSHPLTIVLLCHRALASLKTGEAKSAIDDADSVIGLIGPSCGDNEQIYAGADGQESMRELWGNAAMCRAEALEQIEKWKDAADAWKICVENNVGANIAIQGFRRCTQALTPQPVIKSIREISRSESVLDSEYQNLRGAFPKESEAVLRLRNANYEAEKAEEERFALADVVNERVDLWRDGKRDNLRALLSSLDSVLWEGSGWKKLSMNELLQSNKVKIHYLKAIGKCHPDKLPQDSSTKTRLIAALVFSTLNESWDKFKEQNGM